MTDTQPQTGDHQPDSSPGPAVDHSPDSSPGPALSQPTATEQMAEHGRGDMRQDDTDWSMATEGARGAEPDDPVAETMQARAEAEARRQPNDPHATGSASPNSGAPAAIPDPDVT